MKLYLLLKVFSALIFSMVSCETKREVSGAEPTPEKLENEDRSLLEVSDILYADFDEDASPPLPRLTARVSATGLHDVYLDGKLFMKKEPYLVSELPRPNSGTFSYAQAEARKNEILENLKTPMLLSWDNPYMGFSIHIHEDESITIYNHSLKLEDSFAKSKVTTEEVSDLANNLPLYGNPGGVLITSEKPLKESKIIHAVLKEIFVPSIQIFYVGDEKPEK